MALTKDQIESEVDRVSALVREYIEDSEKFAEEHDYTDIRFRTWQVGCVIMMRDEDEDEHEIVTAAFESSSRVLQTGMMAWIFANAINSGETVE